jgi:ACR3 family arsenite efflux pump ArsB
MRGTWRAETQSTRAFVELWRKRAASRLRLLRISIYVSVGWLVICAMLTALNWRTIGVDVKAHPRQWLVLLVLVIVMQPVIGLWAAWLWRRKVAELQDVQTILDGMNG